MNKHYEPFSSLVKDFYKFHTKNWTFTKDKYLNYNKTDFYYKETQIIGEFFEAWEKITQYIEKNNLKKITFLEIGAYDGLWGLMLSYIGENLKIDYEYISIDNNPLLFENPKKTSLFKLKKYYQNKGQINTVIPTDSKDVTNLDKLNKEYNIVFIDGDHSYEGVTSDVKMYSKLATDILLFHDITRKNTVRKAINDSKIKLDEEISYHTTDMGIGIKYIKNA